MPDWLDRLKGKVKQVAPDVYGTAARVRQDGGLLGHRRAEEERVEAGRERVAAEDAAERAAARPEPLPPRPTLPPSDAEAKEARDSWAERANLRPYYRKFWDAQHVGGVRGHHELVADAYGKLKELERPFGRATTTRERARDIWEDAYSAYDTLPQPMQQDFEDFNSARREYPSKKDLDAAYDAMLAREEDVARAARVEKATKDREQAEAEIWPPWAKSQPVERPRRRGPMSLAELERQTADLIAQLRKPAYGGAGARARDAKKGE